MIKVVSGRCGEYNAGAIREFIERGFSALRFDIPEGARVLLKPNLLAGKPPGSAVTTHPAFIEAIAGVFLERSCDVHIGDSPGYESTHRVLKASLILPVIERLRLTIADFRERITVEQKGTSPYRQFVLGEDPSSYDLVVNIPKLKTHTMMGLTLGVKNTFGFVPSFEKSRWHLKAGKDRELFASVLIDIHTVVNPAMTILDGITGMDMNGPSGGRVRNFGLVAMSVNAFALDSYIEKWAGLTNRMPVTFVAAQHGLLPDYETIDFGTPGVNNFKLPATTDTDWNLPRLVKQTLKRFFIKRPRVDYKSCKQCLICREVCPAGAISFSNDRLSFNDDICIRCYCCQEMCPENAIHL